MITTAPEIGTHFKTRLASPNDLEAIWNLYLKTNYLYPEKLSGMGDGGKAAKDNLGKLLSCDDQTFRICLCEDMHRNLLAVCSHGLFSDANDWVMHMTSDRNLKALMEVFKSLRQITKASSADWISWTFRPNNRSIKRLFTSVVKDLDETQIENTTYDYYQLKAEKLDKLAKLERNLQVRSATQSDRDFVINQLSNHSDKIALRSFGEFNWDLSIKTVADKLNKLGFTRARNAWTVEENGEIGGIVIADVAPDWWNTSGLSTGLRFFWLKEDEQIINSLLSTATDWLSQFPIPAWTMLLSPRDAFFKEYLENLGIISQKQYQRLGMPQSYTDQIYDGYEDFMMRFQGGIDGHLHNGIQN